MSQTRELTLEETSRFPPTRQPVRVFFSVGNEVSCFILNHMDYFVYCLVYNMTKKEQKISTFKMSEAQMTLFLLAIICLAVN